MLDVETILLNKFCQRDLKHVYYYCCIVLKLHIIKASVVSHVQNGSVCLDYSVLLLLFLLP